MKIFENKFISINYFENDSLFKVKRLGSDFYSDTEHKEIIMAWRDEIVKYKPKIQLIDYSDFFQPVSLLMQKWIDENLVAPAYNAGMRRVAFVVSSDILAQISLEQIMDEDSGAKFYVNYFDNENDAVKWLYK